MVYGWWSGSSKSRTHLCGPPGPAHAAKRGRDVRIIPSGNWRSPTIYPLHFAVNPPTLRFTIRHTHADSCLPSSTKKWHGRAPVPSALLQFLVRLVVFSAPYKVSAKAENHDPQSCKRCRLRRRNADCVKRTVAVREIDDSFAVHSGRGLYRRSRIVAPFQCAIRVQRVEVAVLRSKVDCPQGVH